MVIGAGSGADEVVKTVRRTKVRHGDVATVVGRDSPPEWRSYRLVKHGENDCHEGKITQ